MEIDYSLHRRLQVANQLVPLGYIDFAFADPRYVRPVTYFKTIANEVTFEVPFMFATTYATNFRWVPKPWWVHNRDNVAAR